MRGGCLRFVIVVLFLVIVLAGWLFGSRPLSMMIDRIHTAQIRSEPITELGVREADAGMIRINGALIDINMPDYHRFPMSMETDRQGRFAVTIDGKSITLGLVTRSTADPGEEVVRPDQGDHVTFTVSKSMSWPTPFDFNFMTGHSPSWKRHLYYRLLWKKSDGTKLDMLWRYEQNFYGRDGWDSGGMVRKGATGLLHARIEP